MKRAFRYFLSIFSGDRPGWVYKRFRCGHTERVYYKDVTDLLHGDYCSRCAEEMSAPQWI